MRPLANLFAICALLALCACGAKSSDSAEMGLRLKDGASLGQEVDCGLDENGTPKAQCPQGTLCAVVRLESGDVGPVCVASDICSQLECAGGGTCAVAESYPAQIFCSGTCTGADCDEPVTSD